jgi:hypothetical protein
VYSEASLNELQEELLNELCSILAVDKDVALALCIRFEWNSEKIQQELLLRRKETLGLIGCEEDEEGSEGQRKKQCLEESFDCSICFGEVEKGDGLGHDTHLFCRECYTEHLQAKLDEGGIKTISATCPWQGCPQVIIIIIQLLLLLLL